MKTSLSIFSEKEFKQNSMYIFVSFHPIFAIYINIDIIALKRIITFRQQFPKKSEYVWLTKKDKPQYLDQAEQRCVLHGDIELESCIHA